MNTNQAPPPEVLLAPFVAVAKGIPDNWPGECILRFDQRNDGSIYLSYHGINDASRGITITQWRALLGANGFVGWSERRSAPTT